MKKNSIALIFCSVITFSAFANPTPPTGDFRYTGVYSVIQTRLTESVPHASSELSQKHIKDLKAQGLQCHLVAGDNARCEQFGAVLPANHAQKLDNAISMSVQNPIGTEATVNFAPQYESIDLTSSAPDLDTYHVIQNVTWGGVKVSYYTLYKVRGGALKIRLTDNVWLNPTNDPTTLDLVVQRSFTTGLRYWTVTAAAKLSLR